MSCARTKPGKSFVMSPDRTLHGLDARPVDIDRVDRLDLHERHTPTYSLRLDLLRGFFASRSVELFRVIDPDDACAGFQDHCASGYWPRKRAHSGLFHACHGALAAFPERGLEAEHLAEALPSGPIFEAPLIDRSQDGAGSRAGVGPQDLFDASLERSFLDDMALCIERILGQSGLHTLIGRAMSVNFVAIV